jgi:hypothetical protein
MSNEQTHNQSDIVKQLRLRACSVEEQPASDHGHSDCYLEREAADEIERLRGLIAAWADTDDQYWNKDIPTHVAEDRYILAWSALREAIGR